MLADGTWIRSASSTGRSQTLLPDGTEIMKYPRTGDENGYTRITQPDGTVIKKDAKSGEILHSRTIMPDGTEIVERPDSTTSTKPDGTIINRFGNGNTETFHKDVLDFDRC